MIRERLSGIANRAFGKNPFATLLFTAGVLLILGAAAKLAHIGLHSPSALEVEQSAAVTRELKIYICNVSTPSPRMLVDPCGDKDVHFGAISGRTIINVYGISNLNEMHRIADLARNALRRSELGAIDIVFNDNLDSRNSKTLTTFHLKKEIENANR